MKRKAKSLMAVIIFIFLLSVIFVYVWLIHESCSNDADYITTPNGTRIEVAEDCIEYNSNVEFGQVVDYSNEFKTVIIYNGYSNTEYRCETEFKTGTEVCVVFADNGDVDEILEVTEENIVYD